jgi:hypothetical protein
MQLEMCIQEALYLTTHTVRKKTSSTPFGLSKNCRFSYIILEALKFTSKQMYLFPHSVENSKQNDRNKCDTREKIAVGFSNGIKHVKLLPVEATGTRELYIKTQFAINSQRKSR